MKTFVKPLVVATAALGALTPTALSATTLKIGKISGVPYLQAGVVVNSSKPVAVTFVARARDTATGLKPRSVFLGRRKAVISGSMIRMDIRETSALATMVCEPDYRMHTVYLIVTGRFRYTSGRESTVTAWNRVTSRCAVKWGSFR